MKIDLLTVGTAAAMFVLCAHPCLAQDSEAPDAPQPGNVFFRTGAVMPLVGAVNIIGGEGSVMGEVVVDNPYSAESITESTQMLADGNRITHTNRARIYRDSEGRTRREHFLNDTNGSSAQSNEATIIVIDDPVAGSSYILDTSNKTARSVGTFHIATTQAVPAVEGAVSIEGAADEGGAIDGAVVAEEGIAGEGEPVRRGVVLGTAGQRVFSTVEEGPERRIRTIRLQTRAESSSAGAEPSSLPPLEVPPFGPSVSFFTRGIGPVPFVPALPATLSATFAGSVRREDLGEQVLEGVLAEGTRETQTIPAGAIGNELPIEVVSQRWYSPEIKALMLRQTSDPRFGETSYRLVKVDRSEPAPELFMVPQDYELQADGPMLNRTSAAPASP